MKQTKPSSLARILGYAGGHKNLTVLGCILSALSAVLGLAPYLCVWLVARSILAAWPSLDGAGDLGRFGWMAVCGLPLAASCCTSPPSCPPISRPSAPPGTSGAPP